MIGLLKKSCNFSTSISLDKTSDAFQRIKSYNANERDYVLWNTVDDSAMCVRLTEGTATYYNIHVKRLW